MTARVPSRTNLTKLFGRSEGHEREQIEAFNEILQVFGQERLWFPYVEIDHMASSSQQTVDVPSQPQLVVSGLQIIWG